MTLSADTQRSERHVLLAGMLAEVGDLGFDRPVCRVDQSVRHRRSGRPIGPRPNPHHEDGQSFFRVIRRHHG